MKPIVTLSLISHTNVGKTTLARTLLKRDIGEVVDREHVTDASESHTLIETGDAALRLWDTPGFGDTARLLRRLRHERDPLGWFLHRVWDRIADRPMWCSQEAVRNVRDEADVVLYLVNAAEEPGDAGYVPLELELLSWMRRPVLVLLNQAGRDGAASIERWRAATATREVVRDVLSLDAFARCWTEEGLLLQRIEELLEGTAREAMRGLREAWIRQNLDRFRQSCASMAGYIGRAALDRERPGRSPGAGDRGTLARMRDAVTLKTVDRRRAASALARRLDTATRGWMDRLIELHGLEGASAAKIERGLLDLEVRNGGTPLDEKSGALLGGAISGALGGLAADALAGGLTLGGGLIAGGILGALGGAALGRGFRWLEGDREPTVGWSAAFLDRLCRQAALRYLAVAHFGRGRGEFRDLEQPAHWRDAVDEELRRSQSELHGIWDEAGGGASEGRIVSRLEPPLTRAVRRVLVREHPNAASLFEESPPLSRP